MPADRTIIEPAHIMSTIHAASQASSPVRQATLQLLSTQSLLEHRGLGAFKRTTFQEEVFAILGM